MTAKTHHPHDKLVRSVFSDPVEAASFIREYLPAHLSTQLDWSTLELVDTNFVDEALQESESDLLFQIIHTDGETTVFLYLLFEHQSTPDKWMRLRLHDYEGLIWAESFKLNPKQETLPPILPLVFYQGTTSWNYSTEFADLLPEKAREWQFVPHFRHFLVDQSGIGPEDVKGELKAKIVQLLMLAAYHKPIQYALEQAAELLAQVQVTGGVNYTHLFVTYLTVTQERKTVEEFVEMVEKFSGTLGGDMVTAAEEWKLEGMIEGMIEGRVEGKIETIDNLLKMNVDWNFIEQATGINQQTYRQFKERQSQAAASNGHHFPLSQQPG